MKPKLSPDQIEQIKRSSERVIDAAARLGVSPAAISKYRPRFPGHLSDLDHDGIVVDWLNLIPVGLIAARLRIHPATVYRILKRTYNDLLEGNRNGPR